MQNEIQIEFEFSTEDQIIKRMFNTGIVIPAPGDLVYIEYQQYIVREIGHCFYSGSPDRQVVEIHMKEV